MESRWTSKPGSSHSWSTIGTQMVVSAAVGVGIVTIMSLSASGTLQARLIASGAVTGVAIWASCFVLAVLFEKAICRLAPPVATAVLGRRVRGGWRRRLDDRRDGQPAAA